MSWNPDLCIFHSGCNDGFAAAHIVNGKWRDVAFMPYTYSDTPPALRAIAGKNILIADFSFPAPTLREMAKAARSIIILDHHKTAAADLQEFAISGPDDEHFSYLTALALLDVRRRLGMPPVIAQFDQEQSGATLTWSFACPALEMPLFYRYIRDHDLWRHALIGSLAVNAAVSSYPKTFEAWTRLLDATTSSLIDQGVHILRANDKLIQDLLPTASMVRLGGHSVPALNMPLQFASLAGSHLLRHYPGADFVAIWHRFPDCEGWSLRSEDDREDVSAIARKFGGGGHRNAAGFRIAPGAILTQKPE